MLLNLTKTTFGGWMTIFVRGLVLFIEFVIESVSVPATAKKMNVGSKVI